VVKTVNGLNGSNGQRIERIRHPFGPSHPLTDIQKGFNMLDRRKFLKIFGFVTLAFSFLPGILSRDSTISAMTVKSKSLHQTKNWLNGSSRKGCSTSKVAVDHLGSLEDGLDDFLNFRIPTEFE
jgi:hypothetical protein